MQAKRVGQNPQAASIQCGDGLALCERERLSGGQRGIGQKRTLPTVVDESADLFDVVYVSGGRRGLDLGLSPTDLVRVTGAVVADIRR